MFFPNFGVNEEMKFPENMPYLLAFVPPVNPSHDGNGKIWELPEIGSSVLGQRG